MLSRRGVRGRDILMTYHCLSSRRSVFGKDSTVGNGHIRLIVLMMGFMTASRCHRSTVCTVPVVHTQQRDMSPQKNVWQVGSASHCSPWAREQRSNEGRSKDRCEGWSAPPFAPYVYCVLARWYWPCRHLKSVDVGSRWLHNDEQVASQVQTQPLLFIKTK